jgi:hypothetical protein
MSKSSSKLPERHTRCHQIVALLDSAERIMLAARRRGAAALGPQGIAILDEWFKEKESYAACESLCESCPLRPRHAKEQRV